MQYASHVQHGKVPRVLARTTEKKDARVVAGALLLVSFPAGQFALFLL